MSNIENTKKNQNKITVIALLALLAILLIAPFASTESSNNGNTPETVASCANGQFATSENNSGNFFCGSALTTQTSAFFNYGSCSNLNLYLTAISTTTGNCARVNQGRNQTGLSLYTQLDEGSGSTIYDLSAEKIIGSAINNPTWIQDTNCIFQQYCLNFTKNSIQQINLGHDYNDSGTNPITMCEWFFPFSNPVSTAFTIFGDLTFSSSFNGYIMVYTTANQFKILRDASNTAVTATGQNSAINNWYFVCFVYSNPNFLLYVNGIETASTTQSTALSVQPSTYEIGATPIFPAGANFTSGRFSTLYQFNYGLSNSSMLSLYEYVPNPTEQNPVLWNQLTGFPSNCGAGQAVIGFTTTLSCSSFLTTQTSAFFDYGTCPANQFATAITTTTLNCAGVSTEAIATCSLGQFATTESANGGFGCGQPNINFQNNTKTCSDVTATTVKQMGFKLNYTTSESGNVHVTINFQIVTPATINLNTKYRLSFGTGTAPSCNGAESGTGIGNQFTLTSFGGTSATAFSATMLISISVGIIPLNQATTYWFDVQAFDSTSATWTYQTPQLAVIES